MLRIADADIVSITDLHRQVLFTEVDVDRTRLKARVAAERLMEANPSVNVEAVIAEFDPASAEELTAEIDLIVDCSDNFETRMLLNEVCRKLCKPWIHGACIGSTGLVIPFPAGAAACYRCVVDHIPTGRSAPSCEEVGILGPVAGATGCIEAVEAVKMLVDPGLTRQKIIYFDSLSYVWETIDIRAKQNCPVCQTETYEYLEGGGSWRAGDRCTGDSVRFDLGGPVDLASVKSSSPPSVRVEDLDGVLRLNLDSLTVLLFGDGRAIVKGTSDIKQAREVVTGLLDL
jgi:adenylyltransferase/sulfurtransferase